MKKSVRIRIAGEIISRLKKGMQDSVSVDSERSGMRMKLAPFRNEAKIGIDKT